MLKGSLSAFYGMILTFIIALLLTMAECVRQKAVENRCDTVTQEAVERLYSQYNPYLWREYKLLAFDEDLGTKSSSTLKQSLLRYAAENCGQIDSDKTKGVDFFRAEAKAASILEKTYLTDNGGASFIETVVDIQKSLMVGDVMDSLNDVMYGEDSADSYTDYGDTEEVEDPSEAYETLKEMISSGVLTAVIANPDSIEARSITRSPLQVRINRRGIQPKGDVSAADRMVYLYYLMNNYGCFTNEKNRNGVKYELEHILCRENDDKANLSETVLRLLASREAANYGAIMADPGKMEEAARVATVLSLAALSPVAIEPLKYTIIGIWAYVESVLDVRLLLAGGKVALVKSPQQWTSNIACISRYLPVSVKANNCSNGMNYQGYLLTMLMAKDNESLAYNALEVIENNLNTESEYSHITMDQLICQGNYELGYYASPLFYSVFPVVGEFDGMNYVSSYELSY